MQPLGSRNRIALLGLSVGLVLADSSVVTLALPEDPRAVRRRGLDARLGADLVQPGARARGGARGGSCASEAGRCVRGLDGRLRGRVPRVRVLAHVRRAGGAAGGARSGRGRGRRRRARPALRGDWRRCLRGADLGARRDRRRLGRARDRRDPHAALRLGVDLRAPGAGRAGRPPRASRRAGAPCARAGGAAADRGERSASARLGRARGGALPARDPADQRLAPRAAGRGARRDDHAAGGDRGHAPRRVGSARSGRGRLRARS